MKSSADNLHTIEAKSSLPTGNDTKQNPNECRGTATTRNTIPMASINDDDERLLAQMGYQQVP